MFPNLQLWDREIWDSELILIKVEAPTEAQRATLPLPVMDKAVGFGSRTTVCRSLLVFHTGRKNDHPID